MYRLYARGRFVLQDNESLGGVGWETAIIDVAFDILIQARLVYSWINSIIF
jgi:hypothetical protein